MPIIVARMLFAVTGQGNSCSEDHLLITLKCLIYIGGVRATTC